MLPSHQFPHMLMLQVWEGHTGSTNFLPQDLHSALQVLRLPLCPGAGFCCALCLTWPQRPVFIPLPREGCLPEHPRECCFPFPVVNVTLLGVSFPVRTSVTLCNY